MDMPILNHLSLFPKIQLSDVKVLSWKCERQEINGKKGDWCDDFFSEKIEEALGQAKWRRIDLAPKLTQKQAQKKPCFISLNSHFSRTHNFFLVLMEVRKSMAQKDRQTVTSRPFFHQTIT